MSEANTLPSGLVTFIFTDIVGSAEITYKMPGATAALRQNAYRETVKAPHEAVIRKCVAAHEGHIVNESGDGFMIVFAYAEQAVVCGVEIQRQLSEAAISTPLGTLRVRIGISSGEALVDGEHVSSYAIVKAARIVSSAAPGAVLLSHETRALVSGKIRGIAFASAGLHELKGIGEEELFTASVALHDRVQVQDGKVKDEKQVVQQPFAYDVFLSHVQEDKDVVADLAARLREDGLSVFFNQSAPPEDGKFSHIEQLTQSRMFVACVSSTSLNSEGFISECSVIRGQFSRNRPFDSVISLRLDRSPLPDMMAMFASLDWRPEAREKSYPRLVGACRFMLGSKGMDVPADESPSEGVPPTRIHAVEPSSAADHIEKAFMDTASGKATEISPFAEEIGNAFHEAANGRTAKQPTLNGHSDEVDSWSFSSDGSRAVSGSKDSSVRLWDVASGTCQRIFEGHTDYVRCVALSGDSQRAISGSLDNTVRLWDVSSGACLRIFQGHSTCVVSVALSGDGKLALSGSGEIEIRLWDVASGECLRLFEGHTHQVTSVVLSDDDKLALSGSDDKTIRLWDVATGTCRRVFKGHFDRVFSVALSHDGTIALSGSADKTVRLWDVRTGVCIHVFEGHSERVWSVALSGDGRLALSGCIDKTVRLWDVDSGDCLKVLEGHTNAVRSVALSRDGRRAWSGDSGGAIHTWDISEFTSEPEPAIKEVVVSHACDSDEGVDRLGILPDVKAFSSVLAYKNLQPPLCLGIFGPWGSGKSFFMKKIEARIEELCEKSEAAEQISAPTNYCSRIAQIRFNAWHYVDANLWASLACHIFESLDRFISEHSANPVAAKAELFKQSETAKEKLKEAEAAKFEAEQERKAAEKKLVALETERQEKAVELAEVREAVVKEIFAKGSVVGSKLDEAAKQVGLERLSESSKELDQALHGLHSFFGKFHALGLALSHGKSRESRIAVLLVIFVGIPALGWGLETLLGYLKTTGLVAQVGATIAQVSVSVAGLAAWLNKNLHWSNGLLADLEQAKSKADAAVLKAQQKISPEEASLRRDVAALQHKEESACAQLKEAQEKAIVAEKAKDAIEHHADGRVLAEFIRQKVQDGSYQNQLGIISSLRKDFEALSKLLDQTKQSRPSSAEEAGDHVLPRIDRIVLYIDDLDRCPEKTVVEVLQAIHLLLGMRLFIVVIGVDSRWLVRSLSHHHMALRGTGADIVVDGAAHSSTTPQHYLEKIIQVPFNLRRMDATGFGRLMGDILPVEQVEAVPIVSTGLTQPVAVATSSVPAQRESQSSGFEASLQETEPRQTVTPNPTGPPAGPTVATVESVNLVPESLLVTKVESEFMNELAEIISTPRAAKRLGNIYRLLRAGIPASQMEKYLGKESAAGEFRTVMSLLAIQVGFPFASMELFESVNSGEFQTWDELQAKLNNLEAAQPAAAIGAQGERKRFLSCLEKLKQKDCFVGVPEDWVFWSSKVCRYSFRSAEIGGG